MKLKDGYVLTPMAEDFVLVPTGAAAERFHGIVRLNESAAFIVRRLETETSREEIVNAMLEEYEVTRETAETHTDKMLSRLQEIGAIG